MRLDAAQQLSAIQRCLHSNPVDVDGLRALSPSSFLSIPFRRTIWPLLLHLPSSPSPSPSPYPCLLPHPYASQVDKDIARSLHHFDVCRHWKAKHRAARRAQLARLIHSVFSLHPQLHYIQGYHDIASVLLLVLDDEALAFACLERLSLMHIKDSLQPTLSTVISSLSLVFPLLRLVDPALCALMLGSEVQSFFTLSWVLTWFSHNVERFDVVQHFFDFFLSSHPLMPVYMVVALIRSQREAILAIPPASPPASPSSSPVGSTIDASAIHALFQSLSITSTLEARALCLRAQAMFVRYPPRLLCGLTDTPPEEGAKVRVQGMDDLVRGVAEDEKAEERRRRRAGKGSGWPGWGALHGVGKQWVGDALGEWGWMGAGVIGLGLAVAAYRVLVPRS